MSVAIKEKDVLQRADRESAWQGFLKEPLPAPKAFEEWRKTPVAEFGLDQLLKRPDQKTPIRVEGLSKNVEALSLDTASQNPQFKEIIDGFGASWLSPAYRKIELTNQACWNEGLFLHIGAGVQIQDPIRIHVQANSDPYFFPRIVIFLEKGSSVIVIEEHGDVGRNGAANSSQKEIALSALHLAEGSSLRYFYLQDRPQTMTHFFGQNCRLKEKATLEHFSILLGGRIHKSDLTIQLEGNGAKAEVLGTLLGSDHQHFDFYSRQKHSAPNTYSQLLFNVALAETAKSIYTGLIRIEENAKDSEAYQTNHNLLLSEKAQAVTTPILEILTDSVHCKHGATAGSLSEDDLFYAATRGLSPEQAKELLVFGFFSPILSKLPSEEISSRLETRIQERLGLSGK